MIAEYVQRLRADARGAEVSAWCLLIVSLLFLVAVGWCGAGHQWAAVAWCAGGAWLFAWLAGTEKAFARATRAAADDVERGDTGPLITGVGAVNGWQQ